MDAAVFDTNILIRFSYNDEAARRVLKGCAVRYISVMTWLEFLAGVPLPQMERSKTFLSEMFEIIYPDEDLYGLTLNLRREKRLKLPDSMIYATAKSLGVPLVTLNTKDFNPEAEDIYVLN